MHKIVSKTKRLGGGFGGKETRSIFIHCAIAVPAYHLKRPVKTCLDRDEDMQMTGGDGVLGCTFPFRFYARDYWSPMELLNHANGY